MPPPDPTHRRGAPADTDSDWELLGETDPYWAVVTFDRFRRTNLDSDNLREFFERGEREVAHMFEVIRAHL